MSNSSPTIQEKIRHRATIEAYAKARQLGYRAVDAAEEANRVGKFVDRIAEEIADAVEK